MLKQLTHIFLGLLLMLNTSGVLINSHYCGDHLASYSFYLDADPCFENEAESDMGDCCHDESIVIQLDGDYVKQNVQNFDLATSFTFVLEEYSFLTSIFTTASENQYSDYSDYSPPLLTEDIPIEVQSFLL